MKRILAFILAALLSLSLAACGQPSMEGPSTEPPAATTPQPTVGPTFPTQAPTAMPPAPTEPTPDYSAVPDRLQGVWGDINALGTLTIYAFQGDQIETFFVNLGKGAADAFSGSFSISNGRLDYDFGYATGYSTFTYENDTLTLFNGNGEQILPLSAAQLMEYLNQEESSKNWKGVLCLADVIAAYYPASPENTDAAAKKAAAIATIEKEGQAALKNMKTTYDKVQKLTWYEHKNQPKYIDTNCYLYPYIGRKDDGTTWLRVKLNYTDAKTNAGWIFFHTVIFSVDGENTTRRFNRSDIIRDNDTEVWETADFEPNATEILLLRSIANSEETIIRFQGDEYHYDHVVTKKEKQAILDMLTAYDYLLNYAD